VHTGLKTTLQTLMIMFWTLYNWMMLSILLIYIL
jgi:hypothetical protein